MHGATVMQEDTQVGDCSTVVIECLAMQEAFTEVGKKTFNWIIMGGDSQVIMNAICRDFCPERYCQSCWRF